MELPSGMYWLLNPAISVGVPLFSIMAAALIYPAWLALRGQWRSWVVAPSFNASTTIATSNNFPFTILCAGLCIVVAMPSLLFEAIAWEEARKFVWAGPFWAPLLATIVSLFWWPAFLGPAWYRDWRAAGGRRHVLPWTAKEIAKAQSMPEGRKKLRILRNIEVSQRYVDQALASLP